MSEGRRDSTSSLQRKKPPWLKLDIPVPMPPAAEEPSFLQPLRRQTFLRSVSMPAEAARVPSPHRELRRPVLQRQTSITQTIRRYCLGRSPDAGSQAPFGLGLGRSKSPSGLSFSSAVVLLSWGLNCCHPTTLLSAQHSLSVSTP